MAKKAFVYDGTQWVDIAQSTTDLSNYANMTTTPISGFRNKIINGNFEIWQRGTGSTTGSGYKADRWYTIASGTGTTTTSRIDFLNDVSLSLISSRYGMQITKASGATTGDYFYQRIENVASIKGDLTYSLIARSDVATTLTVTARQWFGTGGSPSASVDTVIGTINVPAASSIQRFSVTGTLPSIVGKTIGTDDVTYVEFFVNITNAANSYLIVTDIQVEEGTIATPFEQRPIGTELALCQRYFLSLPITTTSTFAFGHVQSGTTNRYFVPTPVSMRTVSTVAETYVTFNSIGGSNQALTLSGTPVETLVNGISISGTVATAQTSPLVIFAAGGTFTANAEL
jgi:hypothetical protein